MAQKTKVDPPLWRCDVEFRDTAGDAIRSDGQGVYMDGTGGFICTMSPHDVAGTVPGSGNFYFDRRPTRGVLYPAQSQPGATWGTTSGAAQIRVLDMASMALGATAYSAFRSPSSPLGKFFAEDLGETDAVRDEVRVVRTGVCTWEVTFAPEPSTPQGEGRMERTRRPASILVHR